MDSQVLKDVVNKFKISSLIPQNILPAKKRFEFRVTRSQLNLSPPIASLPIRSEIIGLLSEKRIRAQLQPAKLRRVKLLNQSPRNSGSPGTYLNNCALETNIRDLSCCQIVDGPLSSPSYLHMVIVGQGHSQQETFEKIVLKGNKSEL